MFEALLHAFLPVYLVYFSSLDQCTGQVTYRTSFGAFVDIFKTRNKQRTPTDWPSIFPGVFVPCLTGSYGADNCVTVNLHRLKPELN